MQVQMLVVLTEKASGSVDSVTRPTIVGHNGKKCTITNAQVHRAKTEVGICGIDVGYASACASLVAHLAKINAMTHAMTRVS